MCSAPTADDDAGSTWTICWQAAVGRSFLADPGLHFRIRRRLIGAHEADGRILIDYLVLPGEIHAVTQLPPGDTVASVAYAFSNVVSRWVREIHPVRSPVFAGPFQAQRIESVEELRQETRMLGWRPVFLGLCATPTHCQYSSVRTMLGLTTAKGFESRPLLQYFGSSVNDARESLKRWMRRRPSEEEWRAWELAHGLAMATGTVGPRPGMARSVGGPAAALIAAGGTYDVDGALALLVTWVTAKVQSSSVLDLRQGSGALEARGRALVACLAVTHRLCSAASVARYFHRAKATLSEQMSACRSRSSDRHMLQTPVRRIVEEASALRAARGPGPPSASGL
jgi:hypothetical protein